MDHIERILNILVSTQVAARQRAIADWTDRYDDPDATLLRRTTKGYGSIH